MIGVVGLGTPLCQRLGIEHPVWCAGMGAAAGPDLVATVSNAGGLGVLGAAGTVPEYVRRRAARVRELTDRPFGVNLIIDEDDPEDREYIRQEVAAAAEQAALVVLFWGDPGPYVEVAHRAGTLVIVQVGSAGEARAAAAAGAAAGGRHPHWDLHQKLRGEDRLAPVCGRHRRARLRRRYRGRPAVGR